MTQQDLSKQTGIAQSHISVYLRDIEKGNIIRKPIAKLLDALGKKVIIVDK